MANTPPWTPMPQKYLDFKVFLRECWHHLMLPDPTPVQYNIADYLQDGPRRKIIEAFRGVGKSWVTSAYVVWRLRQDPNLKFLVVSASKDRSDNFTTFTMRLIQEMPLLQCLTPRSDQRNSKVAFDVAPCRADHAPSVKSVGIFGQLAGSRANEIVADDIEVPNNAFTQGMRDKLSEAVKEFDAILKPGGTITYLGTPQTEQSLYNVLPERGYEVRIWPARFPSEKQVKTYGHHLAPMISTALDLNKKQPGDPTDAKRFDDVDLMEREASYGRSGFALQFMLDTSLADADRYPLKLSDLIVTSMAADMAPQKITWAQMPELVHTDLQCVGLNGDRYYRPAFVHDKYKDFQGSILAIDPAGRGKDETGYAVAKVLNGMIFIPEAGGLRGGYSEDTLTEIANIAKRNEVNLIVIESNFGDGMFTQLLKPYLTNIYPCTTEEVRHSTQKERRIIETLEPVMNQHRLIIDRKVILKDIETTKHLPPEKALKYQLMYQMSRITLDRGSLAQDDRLDALAIAVNYWVETMAQDVDQRVLQAKEELLQKELDLFMDDALGAIDIPAMAGIEKWNGGSSQEGSWF